MERNKYIKEYNNNYSKYSYSELSEIIKKKKKLLENAPIEGNKLYMKNHKNGLELDLILLRNNKKLLTRKYETIKSRYTKQLYQTLRKEYKNSNLLNENDKIYLLFEKIKNNLVNNKTETIDEIIQNNSIGIDTKLYNEIMLTCMKIIVDRKEIDDKNEIYYPDYNNVNFSSIISKRNEFKIDIPKKNKACNDDEFELASYQIFLKNFISENTPYNSLFIYHGTGTGKTCSAVSIAENYRDIYKNKNKRIIILSSRNIKGGWYNNIYNPAKGINQCTGDEYVKMIDNSEEIDDLKRNKLVNNFYEFNGYKKFANNVKKLLKKSDQGLLEIKRTYSNRLLIIDEVHNIRSESETKTENILKYIELAIRHSDNLKLIILSATPMYNKSTEIVWILNMMLLNDKKQPINEEDVFRSGKLRDSGKRLLEKVIRGRVSYIRGETPDKFPIRLYPENFKKYATKKITGELYANDEYKFKFLKLYGSQLKSHQLKVYNEEITQIIDNKIGDNPKMTEDIRISQISNMTYPANTDDIRDKYGKRGLSQIFDITSDGVYTYKDETNPILDIKRIENYSAKIYNILKLLDNSVGIIYIYSFWVEGTIIPLILALEQYGYQHYDNKSFLNYDKKYKRKNNNKFAVITANPLLSSNNGNVIKILTDEKNKNGENIKIIIGSLVSSEGINMKYIREIHVVDPWHHLNRLEQIIGRGIRYCSHEGLEEVNGYSKKNVTIYLHVAMLENEVESVDELMYRIAEEKSIDIGEIEMLLKENAIDCELFKSINIIQKDDVKPLKLITSQNVEKKYEPYDKPYSKACSFTNKCKYICNTKKTLKLKKNNMNTFNDKMGENIYQIIYKYIRSLFKIKNIYTLDEITEYIKEYINIDEDIIYLTLQNMIKKNIKVYYNVKKNDIDIYLQGYIIYNNKYYIFQPINNTDEHINMYERTNMRMEQRKYINLNKLTKKKSTKKTVIKQEPYVEDINLDQVIDNYNTLLKDINNLLNKNITKKVTIDNYNWILSDSKIKKEFIISKLPLSNRVILLKNILIKHNYELYDTVYEYYRENFIYKVDGKYLINIKSDDNPIGFVLFNKIKLVAFTLDGDNIVENRALLEKIYMSLETYEDNNNYADIWSYNDSSKFKIVIKDSSNFKFKLSNSNPPVVTSYKSNIYIKYGIDCVPAQGNNKSYDVLLELIDIINDPITNNIRSDIEKKLFKRNVMCMIFEFICRKYTSTDIIYHLKEDSLYTNGQILQEILKYV